MAELSEGMNAPDFRGTDQKGNPVTLGNLRGKKVILYFYPRDNTPGCTAEAFKLVSDKEKTMLKAYGAWGLKKNYGKEYEGIIRKTFIIDEEGTIRKIFNKVDTKNHTEQILGALSE